MPERHVAAAGLVGLLLAGLLSACGDDKPPPAPDVAPAEVWNPCDGLTGAQAGRAFGTSFTVDDGEPDDPLCVLTPTEEGGPALEANYMLFPAGLDAAFDTMGTLAGRTVELTVPRADAARLVVNVADDSLLVSGFVQNGDLIQTLNLVDPAPYDRASAKRGVRRALAAFSAHADARSVS